MSRGMWVALRTGLSTARFFGGAQELDGRLLARCLPGPHTRWATRGARARFDHAQRFRRERVALLPDALGEPRAAWHVLVNEERGPVAGVHACRCFLGQ